MKVIEYIERKSGKLLQNNYSKYKLLHKLISNWSKYLTARYCNLIFKSKQFK